MNGRQPMQRMKLLKCCLPHLFLLLSLYAGADSKECTVGEQGQCLSTRDEDNERFLRFYINGTWVVTPGRPRHAVVDPSTGETVAHVSLGTHNDTDAAVGAAREAFASWSTTTVDHRRALLEKLLEIYESRQEEMAQLITKEMGAPIDMSRDAQVGSGTFHLETFLDELTRFSWERTVVDNPNDASTLILMEPIGVVALITPWNWPMNQVVLKVVPALAVGCTCILKPSELAPLSSMFLAEMIHQAGFPPGVFNLVNGDGKGVGTQLSRHKHVDMVSFTGSTRAGAAVSAAAAATFKRVSLELGGKGANIIFADIVSDDDDDYFVQVIRDGVDHCFTNSGQSCNAPTRMLVQRGVYDRAVRIAQARAEETRVGNAHESGDHIGPVANQAQFAKVQEYIAMGLQEGARLVTGGTGRPLDTPPKGFFVQPTIFSDTTNDMRIVRDEIFGPVLCIMPFDAEADAIAIANDSPYGLTNYVYSTNGDRRRRMARALRSGMVEMNGFGQDDASPFGGYKASGNGSREGGRWGLEEFCEIKAVTGWWDDDDDEQEF